MTTERNGPCDRAAKCPCTTGLSEEQPACPCVEEQRLQAEYRALLAEALAGSRAALEGWQDTIYALAKRRGAI